MTAGWYLPPKNGTQLSFERLGMRKTYLRALIQRYGIAPCVIDERINTSMSRIMRYEGVPFRYARPLMARFGRTRQYVQ
ncbi:protein of unknown function [Burkholderia multivorans]